MTEPHHHLVSAIGQHVADRMTPVLRQYASDHGWPFHTVEALEVRHNGGDLSVHYPEHMTDSILNQEMGTINTPPAPALRRFSNRMDRLSEHYHADALISGLDIAGAF